MNKAEQFYNTIKAETGIILATGAKNSVTMRLVSPVFYNNAILIFTDASSRKYQQLSLNPNCCISAGIFYAEATAEFLGSTMSEKNKELRDAYCAEFPDAFTEGVEFGGRNAEFILLTPTKLTGWGFENDAPAADEVPSIPFEIMLD